MRMFSLLFIKKTPNPSIHPILCTPGDFFVVQNKLRTILICLLGEF